MNDRSERQGREDPRFLQISICSAIVKGFITEEKEGYRLSQSLLGGEGKSTFDPIRCQYVLGVDAPFLRLSRSVQFVGGSNGEWRYGRFRGTGQSGWDIKWGGGPEAGQQFPLGFSPCCALLLLLLRLQSNTYLSSSEKVMDHFLVPILALLGATRATLGSLPPAYATHEVGAGYHRQYHLNPAPYPHPDPYPAVHDYGYHKEPLIYPHEIHAPPAHPPYPPKKHGKAQVELHRTQDGFSYELVETGDGSYTKVTQTQDFHKKHPYPAPKYPKYVEPEYPKYEPEYPKYEPEYPKYEPEYPKYEPEYPKYEPGYPSYETDYPKYETGYPKYEHNEYPVYDSKYSKYHHVKHPYGHKDPYPLPIRRYKVNRK
ncbi:unnamed protein product [Darwinula stevensoni]|uniref:Uncharacterized protein n=1 Tax=Darwinula stevensoni TaxID=69355 RepID=A0A7R9FPN3_9CRUS|nr:unnamed protein product [Darwinula stevensoni]CAG0897844.1 unnamed protein product [Darwinula stevensoni]